MKKILVTTLFTLTVFVSVFPFVAYAKVLPWNVEAKIVYGDDYYYYNLANNVADGTAEVYLGKNSKWQRYLYLQTLPLQPMEIYNYLLPNFNDILQHFDYLTRQRLDATVDFDKEGFSYQKGQDGIAIDAKKLFEGLLLQKSKVVALPLLIDKAVTVQQLKDFTVVKGSFSTSYQNSNQNRCHNIALATQSLNGTIVGVGEAFSFNQVVGKRTEQNGYKNAKVIENGAYVDGVGGGVCQVSTTLYNALLLAEFIPKACQHTLISGYVLAGFDAMVSDGGADLTFVNDTDYPVYIQGKTRNKTVTFTIYGVSNKYRIERESVSVVEPFSVEEIVDKQRYPELVYEDQTLVVTNGSNGVKSCSYLKYYLGDKLVQTKLIRKNAYKKVNKIIAKGYQPRATLDLTEESHQSVFE